MSTFQLNKSAVQFTMFKSRIDAWLVEFMIPSTGEVLLTSLVLYRIYQVYVRNWNGKLNLWI